MRLRDWFGGGCYRDRGGYKKRGVYYPHGHYMGGGCYELLDLKSSGIPCRADCWQAGQNMVGVI